MPGRDGPIDISEDGAATVVPLVDTDSTVPKGIKEVAAQCFSTVDSGNPGGQYANDLWCKTTCANHNCPKAQLSQSNPNPNPNPAPTPNPDPDH